MKNEFLDLANTVLQQLEYTFLASQLKEDYIYKKIPQLVNEVEIWNFSSPKTDIGIAAIQLEDMGVYKDEKLVADIVRLANLYRKMQKPAAQK